MDFVTFPAFRSLTFTVSGLMIWLTPMVVRAPTFIRLLSYPVAIACVARATQGTFDWELWESRANKQHQIAEQLEDIELSFEAEAMQQRMELFFSQPQPILEESRSVPFEPPPQKPKPPAPPAPPVPTVQISQPAPQETSDEGILKKISEVGGQEALALVVYLSDKGQELIAADGWINIRQLQKKWQQLETQQLHDLLQRLASAGVGELRAKGQAKYFRFT